MSEPVLVLWASFAAARGEQLELQARRRWSEGVEVPERLLSGPYDKSLTTHQRPWPPPELEAEADRLLQLSLERMRRLKRSA